MEVEILEEDFSSCPCCKHYKYYLHESPIEMRELITWKAFDHCTRDGELLEVRVCASCGTLYVRTKGPTK